MYFSDSRFIPQLSMYTKKIFSKTIAVMFLLSAGLCVLSHDVSAKEEKKSHKKNLQKEDKAKEKSISFSGKGADLVAVVGAKPITAKDLDTRIKLILVTSGIPLTPENLKALREQVLKNMIEEAVQLAIAAKFKVLAKDSEITSAIKHMAKDNNMKEDHLTKILKENGIDVNYLRDRVKAQLSWMNFVRGAYTHMMHVSDKEVDLMLEKDKQNQEKDQYEVFEIFLRADNPSQMPAVEAQAQNLIKQLKAGANFKVLAQQFSNSPTASRGGHVGWVTKAHEGSKAYHDLDVGQASYPVQTNHGYYIYFLADKKLAGQAAVGDQMISFKKIVLPLTPGVKPDDDPFLAAHLNEIMPEETASGIEKVARERGLKVDTITDMKVAHFPHEFQNFLKSLPKGKPSIPSLTPDGLAIFIVTGTKQGEPKKPLTKEEARDHLEAEKLSRIAAQNLNHLIAKTYIKIYHPSDFPNLRYGTPQHSKDPEKNRDLNKNNNNNIENASKNVSVAAA